MATLSGPGASRAGYGYMPDESAALSQAFGQQVGFLSGSHPNFLRLMTRGVGLGAIAAYRGQLAPGVGGTRTGGNIVRMVSLAMKEGLRGARVDQFLQAIAANTAEMGRQGLNVNVSRMEEFAARMQATGGPFKGQGMRLGSVSASLSRAQADARSTLLGPFGGLARSALLARAAQSGGGVLGMVKAIEKMQGDPNITRKAMVEMFGGRTAALGFASMGATSGMATGLAGRLKEPSFPSLPSGRAAGLMGRVAAAQQARLNTMSNKDAKDLIATVEELKDTMNKVGDGAKMLTKAILKVASLLGGSFGAMDDAIKKTIAASEDSHKKTPTPGSKDSDGKKLLHVGGHVRD